jgi:protein-S-isoprenylcysteine O-methyltransferase Ste14
MAVWVYGLGMVVAVLLLAALAATYARPSLQIWPTPGPKTWQSYVFWPLFRGLNVLCFVTVLIDRTPYFGLPIAIRGVALIVLASSVALFVHAFRTLGRDKSYGANDGLVSSGIYQWSRNPQNAMLMVVYASLAIAADAGPTYVLCGAMVTVYVLMVLSEEPWLEGIYGEPYRQYCRSVPRFFNWRRALSRTKAWRFTRP